MRLRGGYNIELAGRPKGVVGKLAEPNELYLPLRSKRFSFSEICVEQGQHVNDGDVLAKDPDNYVVPLLAPRGGKVEIKEEEGYIALTDISPPAEKVYVPEKHLPHIVKEMGTAGMKRYKLLSLGAWQFFHDAYTGQLPDPLGIPQAVIVSMVSFEPFVARGDAQLHKRLLQFTRGLEHLQSLLEYQPIYLVMPDIRTAFAAQVQEQIRGYAWVKVVKVPTKYPYGNFNILARHLGLKKDSGPIWAVRTEGVLAIDRALTVSKPCLVRIVSIGGPSISSPVHLKTIVGYPLKSIIEKYAPQSPVRVITGGIFTGEPVGAESLGLDTECRGLTILPELESREFLGFMRPGSDRKSYSGCFLSSLRSKFTEKLTTGMRGEGRPCVSCNFCEEVCPANIMPYLIHKYLYRDLIEEADFARVDLCVECGLCSFVCPSKIDLRKQFIEIKEVIAKEKEEIRLSELREQELQQLQENSSELVEDKNK